MIGAVIVVILAASSASRPPAAHEYLPALSLDGSDVPGGGINRPCGVAVDSQGDLYVSNSERSAIDVLGLKREHLGAIRDPGWSCGLAVDTKGALYTLESGGRVLKYLPSSYPFDGTPAYGAPQTIDASGRAKGIAVDAYDNRLYVAEGNRIDVYKANGVLGQNEVQRVLVQGYTSGTFTLSFEGKTTRPIPYDATQAEVKTALARLPSIGWGNVLVREGTNGEGDHFVTFTGALGAREVAPLRADGSNLKGPRGRSSKAFGVERLVRGFSGHIGEGLLRDAVGVAVYTYDGAESGVGGLLAESPGLVFASPPGKKGELHLAGFSGQDTPRSAAEVFVNHLPRVYRGYSRYVFVAEDFRDAPDRILVLAGGNIRALIPIARIDGSQTPAKGIDFGSRSAALGVDRDTGHLFAWDAAHSVIDEFEATGAYVAQIADSAFGGIEPTGIAVERSPGPGNGRIYAATGYGILAFGPLRARRHKPRPGFSVKLPEACGTAVDSHGDVYLSGDGEVRIFAPGGRELGRIADLREPCKLTVDSAGNLYATERRGGSKGLGAVVVYGARAYPPSNPIEFDKPKTIVSLEGWPGWTAIDPANDHLLINLGELNIAEYGAAAEGSTLIREGIGKGLISDLESFNGGLGVCAKNGEIYVSGRGFGGQWRIFVLNFAGTRMLTRIDGSGSPGGPFEGHGASLAVDQSNCHVFITMIGRRVEEYEPSGTFVGGFGPLLPYLAGDIAVDNGPSSPNRGDVYVANYEGVSAFGPLGYVR